MESSDTQSHHTLNDEEMGRLVSIAIEEFGAGLTRTRFNDVVLALFEHILWIRMGVMGGLTRNQDDAHPSRVPNRSPQSAARLGRKLVHLTRRLIGPYAVCI